MGRLLSGMGWMTVLSGAAVLAYAQYRSNQTGKDIVTILQNLPDELKKSQAEWQQRLLTAMEAGKQAAAEKEAEIEQELSAQERQFSARETYQEETADVNV